jgi:hypothetical protein
MFIMAAGACSEPEPILAEEESLRRTIECLLDEHDQTMEQILLFLDGTDSGIEEARYMAFNSSDYIRQYCGFMPYLER